MLCGNNFYLFIHLIFLLRFLIDFFNYLILSLFVQFSKSEEREMDWIWEGPRDGNQTRVPHFATTPRDF